VSSLVDSAQSKLESAQDAVKSAQESAKNAAAQAMANASKSDPRMDPYLARNASVYYGTATEQFYKEITWQQASLNAANQNLSVEQQALQAAQQELATAQAQYTALQSIADSANRMAAQGMSPDAIGAAVAKSLRRPGLPRARRTYRGPPRITRGVEPAHASEQPHRPQHAACLLATWPGASARRRHRQRSAQRRRSRRCAMCLAPHAMGG
jgi:hypothetical protein